MKNIGIITSGGDCGGLNGVVKGASLMAVSEGMKCFVIPNGYAGLYNLIDFDKITELTISRSEMINANLSGSEAGHSRVKVKKIKDDNKYNRIKDGLKKFSIDALIISGGDDTGSVVVDLSKEGIPCVHVPKTMDLDLQTYSVGGDSTINRISEYCNDLKTTGRTHNRIIVVEVFGRYAGHTAFRGGIAADADAILIPEIPVDLNVLYRHIKNTFTLRIRESDVYAGTYLIVVAEGLKDASGKELVDESAGIDSFGHKKLAGAGKYVCQQISKIMKGDPDIKQFMKDTHMFVEGLYEIPEARDVTPGHLVRAGNSSAYDVNFGLEGGAAAVQLLKNGIIGKTVVGMMGNKVRYMDTEKAIQQRHVDPAIVALHEKLNVCFGREIPAYSPEFIHVQTQPERYL
ncbi:MAG: 6-phosphofructokinase [Candidatus Omnitrophica bacterium]|nr:6-phosphofructokinase [Candidatus Omnitrophota bacterium]